MRQKKQILLCGYYKTLGEALRCEELDLDFFTPDCQMARAAIVPDSIPVVGWGCPLQKHPGAVVMDSCYRLFFPSTLDPRVYLMTPDWLVHWEEALKNMGFDKKTARHFFQRTFDRALLLQIVPGLLRERQAFEDQIGLPVVAYAVDRERAVRDLRARIGSDEL